MEDMRFGEDEDEDDDFQDAELETEAASQGEPLSPSAAQADASASDSPDKGEELSLTCTAAVPVKGLCRLSCVLMMLKAITGSPKNKVLCHASADEQQGGPPGMPDNKAASFARAFARIMESGGSGRGLLQVGAPFTSFYTVTMKEHCVP